MVAASVGVVLIPILLQIVGAVPPWYELEDGTVRILPWMAHFPPTATLVFLILTHLVVIVTALFYVWRLRANLADAERRLRVQSWQLGQIVPEDTRSLLTDGP